MALPVLPEFLPSDDCVAFASWQQVLFMASRAPEQASSFELAARNMSRVLRAHPRGLGLLFLVLHDQKPPSDFSQHALALVRRFRPQTLGIAAVVGAQGFAGAAQRAFSQGVVSVTGMHGVMTLHGTTTEAVAALSMRVFPSEGRGPASSAMRSALTHFQGHASEAFAPQRAVSSGP